MGEYFRNLETDKIELHFEKSEYMELSDDLKKEIKSNFLFSRGASAWVSRCKFPNLYRAEQIAQKLGLENTGNQGDRLTFEEQQQKKAERAEARAERYEARADRATERGETLQKPIDDMHGDIAFFTQPNINTSAGRAFTRRRSAMWAAWERGFEEFKKSEYYKDRAETARKTAEQTKPKDKSFCLRRIDDAQKEIRACKRTIDECEKYLKQMDDGQEPVNEYGWKIESSREALTARIERAEEIAEKAAEKAIYYQSIIDNQGGVNFNRDNIQPGYVIKYKRWGRNYSGRVINRGPKNVKVQDPGDSWPSVISYGDIIEILQAEQPTQPAHPFTVGEEFTVKEWNGSEYAPKVYNIIKITPEKVTIKSGTERARAITPRQVGGGAGRLDWYIPVADGLNGSYQKSVILL